MTWERTRFRESAVGAHNIAVYVILERGFDSPRNFCLFSAVLFPTPCADGLSLPLSLALPLPSPHDGWVYRFPYMSCEVICCEVPDILSAVANEKNPDPLRRLFSLLDEEGDIDAHRAGYLEKVRFGLGVVFCFGLPWSGFGCYFCYRLIWLGFVNSYLVPGIEKLR